MSNKQRDKLFKRRAYRFIIITIVFVLMAACIFTWLPFIKDINKVVIIVIASLFIALYIGTIILVEISHNKRGGE